MNRKFALAFSAFSLFLLNACTEAGIAIANAPTAFFEGDVLKDISYGPEKLQKLDVYSPRSDAKENLPVIVFFYGGRWTKGQKEDFKFVGTALASEGFVVVIPDYRKYPQVRFPAFVEDGALAVNWVHENIGAYNGRKETLFVSGHSSGAHIGSLLVSDERYLDENARKAVKGFAGLAGPYSFIPEAKDLQDMFGPPSHYPQMQAPTFIDGKEPPMLLLYGQNDKSVGLFNLEQLRDKIKAKGGRVGTKIYPDIGHAEIVGTLTWFWRSRAPVLEDVASFFKSQLSP